MTDHTPATPKKGNADEARVVGADRVLAVMIELADHPSGITLEELTERVQSPKSTVHRALTSLRRFGLASQEGRGRYCLGDEFLRLAFAHAEERPDHLRVEPILTALVERYAETAHYAVLSGHNVTYRSKADPVGRAVRLTSVVGGMNPAHSTAVGKMLLSFNLHSFADVQEWLGGEALMPRTARTITDSAELWRELETVHERGYACDDGENEEGICCIAVPAYLNSPSEPSGAVSVSALSYRTPLATLVEDIDAIRAIVAGTRSE